MYCHVPTQRVYRILHETDVALGYLRVGNIESGHRTIDTDPTR